jgi:L-alanine-DL-glutamate epimerase-like enolase superfamily enzyme
MTSTIADVTVEVRTFDTPEREADGTLSWDATIAVVVVLRAEGATGLGWTYSSPAAAGVIEHHLAGVVRDADVQDITAGWATMRCACRNLGTKGLVMQAISAVDIAWWDLKARMLGVSLTTLLGTCRSAAPIYGSGGFTTLTDRQLEEQVEWWQSVGTSAMKIKIGESRGSNIARDLERVRRLRDLAGDDVEIMVDANGAYSVGQARRVGARLDELGVTWFEEPVSSDDIGGLKAVRDAVRCDVTAGEYAADVYDAAALAAVVDCLQLDATRCGGYTGWFQCAALAEAHNLQVSAHCAPAIHAPIAAAVPNLRHVEWFADHARLEPRLVDGSPQPRGGMIDPNRAEPGHGMTLRRDVGTRRRGGSTEARTVAAG